MSDISASQESVLLSDLRSGIPEAVEIWYRKYMPTLQKFVSLKIENKKDVEEICRETFLNCLRDLPLFQGKSSLKTWMLRIASHEVADYYRRRYAKKFIHAIPLSHLLFAEDPKNLQQTSGLVVEALKRMTADHKQLLLLKYVDHVPVKDIALQFGKSIKSVESELFRARKEFRAVYALVAAEAGLIVAQSLL